MWRKERCASAWAGPHLRQTFICSSRLGASSPSPAERNAPFERLRTAPTVERGLACHCPVTHFGNERRLIGTVQGSHMSTKTISSRTTPSIGLNNNDTLNVLNGGSIVTGTAVKWQGGSTSSRLATINNSG